MADKQLKKTDKDILPLPDTGEERRKGPELKLGDFSGPLDLLIFLIEKNEIDLFDIPVAELTDQYLDYLEKEDEAAMDLASDFIVMGASLLELKSRMMLPQDREEEEEDPRDELVLRLLAYRRCKLIADKLKERAALYAPVVFRLPENPAALGIEPFDPKLLYADESQFSAERFRSGREAVSARNAARFQDLSEKMDYIVSREQLNLKTWIKSLWSRLKHGITLSFNRLFPASKGRRERLTGFLAVLELLKQNRITAEQEEPFADIILKRRKGKN